MEIYTIFLAAGTIPDSIIDSFMKSDLNLNLFIYNLQYLSGLYLWNGLALFSCVSAFVTWIVQYYLKLAHNVLLRENRSVCNVK